MRCKATRAAASRMVRQGGVLLSMCVVYVCVHVFVLAVTRHTCSHSLSFECSHSGKTCKGNSVVTHARLFTLCLLNVHTVARPTPCPAKRILWTQAHEASSPCPRLSCSRYVLDGPCVSVCVLKNAYNCVRGAASVCKCASVHLLVVGVHSCALTHT